jgi:hypothetical protein
MHQGLTYFVELRGDRLAELFARPGLLDRLQETGAAVAMAMLDLSEERCEVLRALQVRGIPATVWLVLEAHDGYWLTADNAPLAAQRYREVRRWMASHGLSLQAVGLDLETPHDDLRALVEQGRDALRRLFHRRRTAAALRRAREEYGTLVEEIRRDGFRVETYQFPLVLDERRAGSTLLQRVLGFVDVTADREVLMLYESLLPRPLAKAVVDSYGPEAQAIAVGITGGGVDFVLQALGASTLSLEELVAALRRARRYTPHLYVFSLEGCVQAGYFEALCDADLGGPPSASPLAWGGTALRAGLRLALRTERLWDRG